MQALITDRAIRIKIWLRLSQWDHTANHSDFYKKVLELEAEIRKEMEEEARRKRRHEGGAAAAADSAAAGAAAPSSGCLPACGARPPSPLASLRGCRVLLMAGTGTRYFSLYNKHTRQVTSVKQTHLQAIIADQIGAGVLRASPFTHAAVMSDDATWRELGQHIILNVDMTADLSPQQCFERIVHAGGVALQLLAAPDMPPPLDLNGGLCVRAVASARPRQHSRTDS